MDFFAFIALGEGGCAFGGGEVSSNNDDALSFLGRRFNCFLVLNVSQHVNIFQISSLSFWKIWFTTMSD